MSVFSKYYELIVQSKPKATFLHIGKCGGTSLRQMLRPDSRDVEHMTKSAYWWQRSKALTWKYQIDWIEHSAVHKAIETHENLACFIRQPIERIESAFYYLFTMDKYYGLKPNTIQGHLISQFPDFDFFMNVCLDQSHPLHNLAMDSFSTSGHAHFHLGYKQYFSSADYIRKHKEKFLFLGLFEEFDQETQRLFRTLRVRYTPPKRLNAAPKSDIKTDPKLKEEFAKNFLAEDYDIYNCLLKIRHEQF